MPTLTSHRFLPFSFPVSLSHGLQLLLRWQQLYRERRLLRMLSDHQLRDIGLTRAQAEAEAERPFWDDPRQGSFRY